MAWGWKLILDLYDCNTDKIKCPVNIQAFKNELIPAIKMKSFGEPIMEHFGHHDPKVTGWTMVQLIETSDITCHFAEGLNQAYIDLFSCAPYDPDVVIHMAHKYFQFTSFNRLFLERGKGEEGTHKMSYPVIQHLCGSMGRVA